MSRIVKAPLALIMSALTLGTFAAPVLAKSADQSSERLPVEIRERDGQTLYCISQQSTGSRLPQQVCRTRAEWVESGATFRTTARLALNVAPTSERD